MMLWSLNRCLAGKLHDGRLFGILLIVVLCATGCSPVTSPPAPPAADTAATAPLDLVKVATFPFLSHAVFYIGDREGYFAEEGIDLEIVALQGLAEAITALIRGDVDVSSAFSAGMMNAMIAGEKLRVVANKGVSPAGGCAYSGFLVRTELADSIDTMDAAQLGALTFGAQPNWMDSYMLDHLLTPYGLTVDEVATEYIVDSAARIEAIRAGKLDVIYFAEPWLTRAVNSGVAKVWRSTSETLPNSQIGTVAYGPRLLDREPELGERFMRAYLKSVHQINQGATPRNIEILAEVLGLEPELLAQICFPSYTETGVIDVDAFQDFIGWLHSRGLIDRLVMPEEYYDSRFVDAANAALETGQ